jgi:predicted Fe-S protein YdhL (DUF1289 family)
MAAIKILSSGEPASPCINVCEMDEKRGLCKGCLRTIDEIASWSAMSDDEKRKVLTQLLARRFRRQVA